MRKPGVVTAIFLLLPATLTGLVPWLLTGWHPGRTWLPLRLLGVLLVVAGTAGVVHSFARFVTEGRGTPAPFAPTERLVVGGLYRFVRNPMYVAGVFVIIGQALILGRLALWIYAVGFWLVVAGYVLRVEEPMLRKRFAADYERYRRTVPAWLPRPRRRSHEVEGGSERRSATP